VLRQFLEGGAGGPTKRGVNQDRRTWISRKDAATMPPEADKPPDNFDELLAWLHSDRELAAKIYEEIRRDLIKIFGWNHCTDPEGMADETFDRVAGKAGQLKEVFEGNPKHYFYGVARNLMKEYQKKVKSYVPLEDLELRDESPPDPEQETAEMREDCLQTCLGQLSNEKRELILAYYAKEKQAKIDARTRMADQLGISTKTLRVRMHRIRVALEECIERCLNRSEGQDETD
jgi:RNA polymerase sigma factor (sigma-70 family)